MLKYSGRLLVATGILHNVVGLLIFSPILGDIARAGFFNSIDPHMDRNAAFWFLGFGFMLMLMGAAIHWMHEQTGEVPAFMGWALLAIGLIGVMMMPASGFWLAIPQAIVLLRAKPSREMLPMRL